MTAPRRIWTDSDISIITRWDSDPLEPASHEVAYELADGADDLRNQLAVAKLAADSWRKRADELDVANDEMLAALKALFQSTDDDDDFFYTFGTKGGEHWCESCGASAEDYVRVTHEPECGVGKAEAVIDKAQGRDDA